MVCFFHLLRRIIRDCNDKQLLKEEKNPVLLQNFSSHSLRHTFTTRLVEAGVEKQTENARFSSGFVEKISLRIYG